MDLLRVEIQFIYFNNKMDIENSGKYHNDISNYIICYLFKFYLSGITHGFPCPCVAQEVDILRSLTKFPCLLSLIPKGTLIRYLQLTGVGSKMRYFLPLPFYCKCENIIYFGERLNNSGLVGNTLEFSYFTIHACILFFF